MIHFFALMGFELRISGSRVSYIVSKPIIVGISKSIFVYLNIRMATVTEFNTICPYGNFDIKMFVILINTNHESSDIAILNMSIFHLSNFSFNM